LFSRKEKNRSSHRELFVYFEMIITTTGCRLLFFLVITIVVGVMAAETYYQILGLKNNASLKDIKKAYRRLALEHHPDRNPGNEKASEVVFREISGAYEILSDDDKRRSYDDSLKYGGRNNKRYDDGSHEHGYHKNYQHQHHNFHGHGFQHKDPFEQFDNLFKHDDFFKDAFKGMEDVFEDMFGDSTRNRQGNNRQQYRDDSSVQGKDRGGGFFGGIGTGDILNKLGVGISMQTTSASSTNGRRSSTTTSSSYGGSNSRQSTISKSIRTIVQNGKQMTIQSFEKNGNKIEEVYTGEILISRKINGLPDRNLQISQDF